MKLRTEYHNNYLQYMVQRDGWNIIYLNRYSEVRELLNRPMYSLFKKKWPWPFFE